MVFYGVYKAVIGKRRYDSKTGKDLVFMDLSPIERISMETGISVIGEKPIYNPKQVRVQLMLFAGTDAIVLRPVVLIWE